VSAVTTDAIRHFAWGIGDDNPLWHDPEHAGGSRWGGPVAPPSFLYAVDEGTVAPGHQGLRRVVRSVEWTWWHALTEGMRITPTARLVDESDRGGVAEQTGEVEFESDEGDAVATLRTICVRPAEPLLAVDDRPEVRYSGDQVAEIERRILDETRRGPEPRLVEDIEVGEPLGEIVKGPLSIMDVVAWCAATQGTASDADEYSGGGLHDELATGPEQVAWLCQVLTDWAGDDGFVHRLGVELVTCPPLGSTTTCVGHVVGVDVERRRVEVDLTATDQDGRISARGSATVLLPSRTAGAVQLPVG